MRIAPLFLLLALLGGCSLPRVIVLNDPLDARQHNDLGVAYQQRGEADLALREYERAAELDSEWGQPLLNRGNVLAAQKDWPGAAADYRRTLKREPDNPEAMNNLAWVLLQAGELERARHWAEQALRRQPGEAAFLDTYADILLTAGRHGEARRAIDQALALDPPPALRQSLEEKRSRLPAP
jgi:tetratricopeptide (TPR) repeat protein